MRATLILWCAFAAKTAPYAPEYGHFVPVSLHASRAGEVDGFIRSSVARWTPEGVTFPVPDGHAFFIPARAFTGGR